LQIKNGFDPSRTFRVTIPTVESSAAFMVARFVVPPTILTSDKLSLDRQDNSKVRPNTVRREMKILTKLRLPESRDTLRSIGSVGERVFQTGRKEENTEEESCMNLGSAGLSIRKAEQTSQPRLPR
jgi:hypothetical protein